MTASVKVTVKDVATADTAVKAYEAATIVKYDNVKVAKDLETAAITAVGTVTDVDAKAAFTKRITDKQTALDAIVATEVKAVNDATNQVTLNTALTFFNDVDSNLIVKFDAKIGGATVNTTVDQIQNDIYEVNFLDQFDTAIVASGNVNQIELYSALQYGSARGVLTNVKLDQYFDAYVAVAEDYAGTTDYNTVAKIQTGMINGSTVTVVNAADASVALAIAAPSTGTRIEDAQALVDAVPADVVVTSAMTINTGLVAGDNAKTKYNEILNDLREVKPVIVATTPVNVNQTTLLAALKNSNFARVYANNIVGYADGISNSGDLVTATKVASTDITLVDIQAKIDGINDAFATKLVIVAETTPTTASVAAAQTEINGLLPDYVAVGATPARAVVKGLQDRLNVAQTAISGNAALKGIYDLTGTSTKDDVLSALKALDNVESVKATPAFKYASVDENNWASIKTAVAGFTNQNAAAVQTAISTAALQGIYDLTTTSTKDDVLASLKALDKVESVKATPAFKYASVDENNWASIETVVAGFTNQDTAAVQTAISTAALQGIYDLTTTSTKDVVLASLKALDKVESIKVTPAFKYSTVSEDLSDGITAAIAGFTNQDAAAIQTAVTGVPLTVVNALTATSTTVEFTNGFAALANAAPTSFKLSTVRPSLNVAYGTAIALATPSSAVEIQAIIVDVNNLTDANSAESATAMQTALNAVSVANQLGAGSANINAYMNLTSGAKLEVAQVVLTGRTAAFTNTAAVMTAVNAETDNRATLFTDAAGINMVSDIATMKEALNTYGLDAFTSLDASAQVQVADYLLANRPTVTKDTVTPFGYVSGGYTTIAQINAAIAAGK